MSIEDVRYAIGEVFAGRTHGLTIHCPDFVKRGEIYMNSRDFDDAFTERPTRSDYEAQLMLDAADKLAKTTKIKISI